MEEPVWNSSVSSKVRERLLDGRITDLNVSEFVATA
jgi:hypothetical protein